MISNIWFDFVRIFIPINPDFQFTETAQNSLAPGERPPLVGLGSYGDKRAKVRRLSNHHLHAILKEFSAQSPDDLEIYFSLFSVKENSFVSERVLVNKLKLFIKTVHPI
jgi:hypothetical protein